MPYRNEHEADGWFELLKSMAWLAFTILIGLWLVSAWLTKIFVEHVLDPMTNKAFSRNDGLLILTSALVWAIIIPALLFPQSMADMNDASPEEIWRALVGTLLLGLAWGVSVGVKVVVDLWLEVMDQRQPVYEPVHMLGEPIQVLPSPSSNGRASLPPHEELQKELAEIYGSKAEEQEV
jgi:hypothetical protein